MSSIWLQLSDEDAILIKEAIQIREAISGSAAKSGNEILGKIDLLMESRENDEAFREAVIDKYAGKLDDGDLDFQSDGMVSKGDEGAYVMAFLYVRNSEVFPDMEQDCDEEITP